MEWSFKLADFPIQKAYNERRISAVEKTIPESPARRSPISKALHLTEIKNVDFCPVSKADEWRRIVRAIILKPGQKYSKEEIRAICYDWMEGENKGRVNGAVKVLENMIVPTENMIINGQEMKKGTWIVVLKILSKSLWREFQSGAFHITGQNVQEI